jgi:hypothetical protein
MLRFLTKSQSLGTSMDWYCPNEDDPNDKNTPITLLHEDIITTPFGNSFLYEKGKTKEWTLEFESITNDSMNKLDHICSGWYGKQQVTILYFGTNVTGTTQSIGTYEASQLWGTGFCRMVSRQGVLDMWNCTLKITQFGTNQVF